MNNFETELLSNSKFLHRYLSAFGTDTYNTKEDIIIIGFIYDILNQNADNMFLTNKEVTCLFRTASCLKNKNIQIKYCRPDNAIYANLDNIK